MRASFESDLDALSESATGVADQLLLREGSYETGVVEPFVDKKGWDAFVEMGWPSLAVPEAFGGFGLPLRSLAVVAAAFARHGASHPLTIAGAEVPALVTGAGSSEQARAVLMSMVEKRRLIVAALWDVGHEPSLNRVTTRWVASDGGYRLAGRKSPVAYGAIADAFVVLAREATTSEPALFVVGANASGVRTVPLTTTTGSPACDVVLDETLVAREDRLEGGEVRRSIEFALDVGAALTSAELTVAALRGLELTVDYVKVRRQFNRALGEFQAVHHHCADMYRDVEVMRTLASRALDGDLSGSVAPGAASMAKALASEKGVGVLQLAHQLHGGVGFYVDYPLELLYRRSLVLQGEYGSGRWHRARLAGLVRDGSIMIGRHQDGV